MEKVDRNLDVGPITSLIRQAVGGAQFSTVCSDEVRGLDRRPLSLRSFVYGLRHIECYERRCEGGAELYQTSEVESDNLAEQPFHLF